MVNSLFFPGEFRICLLLSIKHFLHLVPQFHRDKRFVITTKTIEKISTDKAKQAKSYNNMVATMTAKLTAAINAVDPKDTTAVRRLTASLCDLRELLGIKSEADSREQEARIANLRRQADKEDDTVNEIEIVFAAGPEEWNG